MDLIQNLAKKYQVKIRVQASTSSQSFCMRVEAKIKIMEMIKKAATKILKQALPALILFSSATGFARIKDPEGLGKKFQEIASETVGNTDIKTHTISNDEDGQIVVYTVKNQGGSNEWGSASIKYTEGIGAKIATVDASDNIKALAVSLVDTLNAIDAHGKKMAKDAGHQQQNQQKDTKLAGK